MYGQGMGFTNWLCGAGSFMPGPFGMILTILLWGLAIMMVVKAFQYLFSLTGKGRYSSSLNKLKDRYAAGDITREEFEQIKRDIT